MIGVAAQSRWPAACSARCPVEADGSAYFQVPAGVPIYFQALDDDGLAVQSMRSATYVHPGERLACVGCHEDRSNAPPATESDQDAPLAMTKNQRAIRPPIEPETEGP